METSTFKILEDVTFLKGQGLLLLLVQHAVNGDELAVKGNDVREADGRSNHVLRPAHGRALRYPGHRGKHAWENRKGQEGFKALGFACLFSVDVSERRIPAPSLHFELGKII